MRYRLFLFLILCGGAGLRAQQPVWEEGTYYELGNCAYQTTYDTIHPADSALHIPLRVLELSGYVMSASRVPLRARAQVLDGQTIDAATAPALGVATLAALLRRQSPLFIKQSAPGQLATHSWRGGSAGHTAVLWNGMPLTSPQLGLLDLSFLPTAFVDRVRVNTGGQSALYGSGAVVGTLHLDNQLPQLRGWKTTIGGTGGSFGTRAINAGVYYSSDRFQTRTRLFYRSSELDFRYRPLPGLEFQRQTHARFAQRGLLQELRYRAGRNRLDLRVWGQATDRELPPLTTQNQSAATQADRSLRTQLAFLRPLPQGVLKAHVGYTRERIHYRDPRAATDARSGFGTWMLEAEQAYHRRGVARINFGVQHTRQTADADGYPDGEQLVQSAVFLGLQPDWSKATVRLFVRQGLAGGRLLPFLPNLAISKTLGTAWTLHTRLSRNYRLPTLNDRFWRPGGNPDLRPESGWSQEIGLRYARQGLTIRSAGYHRLLRDWILWAPDPEQGFFAADNLTRVRSYGTENSLELIHRFNPRLKASGRVAHSFTRSENQVAVDRPRLAVGQQLWYVPRHQAQLTGALQYEGVALSYHAHYTGSVGGINTDLGSYWLHDLRASWALDSAPWSGTVSVGVHNLYNTWYQVVERRPAPGRYFDFSFQIHFTKAKS